MDSRNKRASAIYTGLPWRGMYPLADGDVDREDRFQSAGLYRASAVGFEIVTVLGSVTGPRAAGSVMGPLETGSVRG